MAHVQYYFVGDENILEQFEQKISPSVNEGGGDPILSVNHAGDVIFYPEDDYRGWKAEYYDELMKLAPAERWDKVADWAKENQYGWYEAIDDLPPGTMEYDNGFIGIGTKEPDDESIFLMVDFHF
jgi:hypothetical protein